MGNSLKLKAADDALAWLSNVSDKDLFKALEKADDTLAYAINPQLKSLTVQEESNSSPENLNIK